MVEIFSYSMDKNSSLTVIEVEVLDFRLGSLLRQSEQNIFLAVERGEGVYRVKDGIYDFTFSRGELDEQKWIREYSGDYDG